MATCSMPSSTKVGPYGSYPARSYSGSAYVCACSAIESDPASEAIRSASREDLGRDAVAAAVAFHREPAEPGHLAAEEQAAGADHDPVVHGHYVRGLRIAPVLVSLERHALLAAEDAFPQRERRGQLGLRACLADLHRQRA